MFTFLNRNKDGSHNEGFTLLELIMVTVFLSLLALVALPNFLRQSGKARELEFQNLLGNINRAQQAYHFQNQRFAQAANDKATLKILGLTTDDKYIDAYNILAGVDSATVAFENNEFSVDGTRAFSGGIFFDGAGSFSAIVCRSFSPKLSILPPTVSNTCPDPDSERIF
jgi:type II secretory pathway pseudopilin PulG